MSFIPTYNGTVYTCTIDINCPGASVCYYINKTTPTQGYCSCNVEQGSKGQLCEQISAGGYGRIVLFSIALAFASAVILAIILQVINLIRVKKMNKFDVRVTSLVMCALSLVFFSGYVAVILYWTLFPGLPVENDKLTGKKRRPYGEFRGISLSLFLFFYITASLNVSILWLEVAIASKRFKRVNRPQLSRKYRTAVFSLDFVFAVVMGFILWFAPNSASTTATVIFIVILMLYIYSAREITNVMKESSQDGKIMPSNQDAKTNTVSQALLLIKGFAIQYSALTILWLFLLILGSALYSGMFKKAWKDDEIPYFMFFFDIAFILAVATAVTLVKYIHDASNKASVDSRAPANEENHPSNTVTGQTGGAIVPAAETESVNPQ